jgi:hypothetical protein
MRFRPNDYIYKVQVLLDVRAGTGPTIRPDGIRFSLVRHDQLLLVSKNFLFDKGPFSSRAHTSNAGVNSKLKKSRHDKNICTNECIDQALIISSRQRLLVIILTLCSNFGLSLMKAAPCHYFSRQVIVYLPDVR